MNIIRKDAQFGVAAYFLVTGVGLTGLATRWEAARIIGLTVLTGAAFSTINHRLAANNSMDIFVYKNRDEQDKQRTLEDIAAKKLTYFFDAIESKTVRVLSKNKNIQAIVFGVVEAIQRAAIAGFIFALIARVSFPNAKLQLSSKQLAPLCGIGVIGSLAIAHFQSRQAYKEAIKHLKINHYENATNNENKYKRGYCTGMTRIFSGDRTIIWASGLMAIGMVAARAGLFFRWIKL